MAVFDALISEVLQTLAPCNPRSFPYDAARAAAQGEKNELILHREAAYELGEGSFPCVSVTILTTNEALVPRDGSFLCGDDLPQLRQDGPFARITLIRTDDAGETDDQAVYALLKSLELIKYELSPKGYMMRPAALSNREQVRVSKRAVKDGLRFENIGNLLLETYHQNPRVRAAQVYFVTLADAPYAKLDALADKTAAIAKTLNHAMADLIMDCRACEWKPVCDEVPALKKLHKKQVEQAHPRK